MRYFKVGDSKKSVHEDKRKSIVWTKKGIKTPIDKDKIFLLITFIYGVIFRGKSGVYNDLYQDFSLRPIMLERHKIGLWALISRGYDRDKSHKTNYHKKNGLPRSSHPEYEGGKNHMHALEHSWGLYIIPYAFESEIRNEDSGFTDIGIEVSNVKNEEYWKAEKELMDMCGLWFAVSLVRSARCKPEIKAPSVAELYAYNIEGELAKSAFEEIKKFRALRTSYSTGPVLRRL